MSQLDELRQKFYETASIEVLERGRLRDNALFIYVASIGAYLSFLFTQHFAAAKQIDISYQTALLVPTPLICLIFTLVILQHELVISAINRYINFELESHKVDPDDPSSKQVVHWYLSKSLNEQAVAFNRLRFFAQAFGLILPMLYAYFFLYTSWPTVYSHFPARAIAIVIWETAFIAWILYFHVRVWRVRNETSRMVKEYHDQQA